ncbi:MAG TPA: methyltransferase [Bryobacteraceae bacterium]|nr:methyltransferase [Bryobacteraceae bacterium]
MSFPKAYSDAVAKLRVPGGFALAAAYIWLAAPTGQSMAAGLPISVIGLLLRAWAAGHLAKNANLATSGPYAYVRNPLYLGTLITAAGLVVAAQSPGVAILFALVFFAVYFPVIQLEEQHLANLFPGFAAYRARVPLLLPRGRRLSSDARFRPALYRRNEEYNAALGWLAAVAVLAWKLSQGRPS